MKLDTAILFIKLIKALAPKLICDIGSRDGYHAILFRKFCKEAPIIAFEAKPQNVRSMQHNESVIGAKIEIQQKAVWNMDGVVDFYIEDILASGKEWRTGISSVRRRTEGSAGSTLIKIPSVRLDTFILNQDYIFENIALWIDVEGVSYEVLEGLERIKDRISVIHVEVETKEVWYGQRKKSDVEELMKCMGFVLLAQGFSEIQPDLVFLNKQIYKKSPIKFKIIVFLSMLSYLKQSGFKLIQQFFKFFSTGKTTLS